MLVFLIGSQRYSNVQTGRLNKVTRTMDGASEPIASLFSATQMRQLENLTSETHEKKTILRASPFYYPPKARFAEEPYIGA